MMAKTNHAMSLHSRNSEPFDINVMVDTSLGKGPFQSLKKSMKIAESPLDGAIKQARHGLRSPAIHWDEALCATTFQLSGKPMLAIGTSRGVCVWEMQNSLSRYCGILSFPEVTQIFVYEELNIMMILASKTLSGFRTDEVYEYLNTHRQGTGQNAPRGLQITGDKKVEFFVTGSMHDRAILFYAMKEGPHTIFKVSHSSSIYIWLTSQSYRYWSHLLRNTQQEILNLFRGRLQAHLILSETLMSSQFLRNVLVSVCSSHLSQYGSQQA
jgi:hypothetical protein